MPVSGAPRSTVLSDTGVVPGIVELRSVIMASRALVTLDVGIDDDDDDDDDGVCTVMRGIVAGLEESGTEHASSNRTVVVAVALASLPRGAGGAGLSPARRSAVHCSAPLERARVGRRNTRVSAVRVQRAVGAPVVPCAKRSVRACNVISTLCLTGAVAEIACSVNSGTSSSSPSPLSSPPPSSNLDFLLLLLIVLLLGNKDDGECLRLAGCWGDDDEGWSACRARWTDVWISNQASRMCGASSRRAGPPDARRSAVSINLEQGRCAPAPWDRLAVISGGMVSFGMAARRASRYSRGWRCEREPEAEAGAIAR